MVNIHTTLVRPDPSPSPKLLDLLEELLFLTAVLGDVILGIITIDVKENRINLKKESENVEKERQRGSEREEKRRESGRMEVQLPTAAYKHSERARTMGKLHKGTPHENRHPPFPDVDSPTCVIARLDCVH